MATKKYDQFTDGNELQAGDQVVGLRADDNTRFDFPGDGIKDASGNYFFKYATDGAAAGNFLQISNALDGSDVELITDGTDTNIDININPKGTGQVLVPTPTTGSAAATKDYVDSGSAGSFYYLFSVAATIANFSSTYNNGASGIGATLTALSNGAAVIDGVTLSVGDFVLFKDQSVTFQNGIYILTTNGTGGTPSIFTRDEMFDQIPEIKIGFSLGIVNGTVNSNTIYQQQP